MRTNKKIVGGIVNKTPNGNNFASVLNMLRNPTCAITALSATSRTGFVFKLHITPRGDGGDIEFFGLNAAKTDFDSPIDTLVLKLAVLSEKNNKELELERYKPAVGKKTRKFAETLVKFKNEAVVQSEIYQKTISRGEPICPALVDYSEFSDHEVSAEFLSFLKSKCADDEAHSMVAYLQDMLNITDDTLLGMITMESADNAKTFDDMLSELTIMTGDSLTGSPDKERLTVLFETMLVNIVRLFNETGIIHCDLHMNNSMVRTNPDGSFFIYIIDFGIITDQKTWGQSELRAIERYANDKFDDLGKPDIVIQSRGNFRISPHIQTGIRHFDANSVENMLNLIVSAEMMYMYREIDRAVSEILRKYIEGLRTVSPSFQTSLENIAKMLNKYYEKAEIAKLSARYAPLSAAAGAASYDRSLTDIFPERKNTQGELDSPSRIIRQRNAADSVIYDRLRKNRPTDDDEDASPRGMIPFGINWSEVGDESPSPPFRASKSLFGDDDDDDENENLGGRTTKKRHHRRVSRKRTGRKTRARGRKYHK